MYVLSKLKSYDRRNSALNILTISAANVFLRKSKTHHIDKYIRMNIIYTSALFDILIWNSIRNPLPDRQQLLLSLLLNDKC